MTMTTLELARKVAAIADDKKGQDILILNMADLSFITDYYVIVSAGNTTLVKAIADHIEDKLGEAGTFTKHKEGYSEGHWILLDFDGVVVHVFLETERDFYNLEQLWADAPSESFKVEENV